MLFLFYLLFSWQSRYEQSGYLANIYQEAVENIEFNRRSTALQWKWLSSTLGS